MLLIPMQNTGQGRLGHQLLRADCNSGCVKADAFGCIADSQHGNAFAGDEALFPQVLQRIAATVILGYHAQTGGTAVHGV